MAPSADVARGIRRAHAPYACLTPSRPERQSARRPYRDQAHQGSCRSVTSYAGHPISPALLRSFLMRRSQLAGAHICDTAVGITARAQRVHRRVRHRSVQSARALGTNPRPQAVVRFRSCSKTQGCADGTGEEAFEGGWPRRKLFARTRSQGGHRQLKRTAVSDEASPTLMSLTAKSCTYSTASYDHALHDDLLHTLLQTLVSSARRLSRHRHQLYVPTSAEALQAHPLDNGQA